MKRYVVLVLLALLGGPLFAQEPVVALTPAEQAAALAAETGQDREDMQLVYDFWREVLVARDMDAARRYMHEDYIQHNPGIPTGRASFIQFFGRNPAVEPLDHITDLVGITASNGLVTLALRREFPNPNAEGETYTTTWFDMFRVEDGMVVEHWDYGQIQAR